MSTGILRKMGYAALLSVAVLCVGDLGFAATASHAQKKAKKTSAPLPPLPSGPTGPVQQVPLDSISAVPPHVTFQNNQLTIVAPNSTLADVLRAVRKQTGAEIDIPPAPDRVVTNLGPGPARSVVADLLNGSRFNYVLLGSPADDSVLTRVVLVPKTGPENMNSNPAAAGQSGVAQGAPPPPANTPDMNDTEAVEDNSANEDNNANVEQPAAEAEQPNSSDQQQVKTPQQMLQEMQQRQMQMQQQQQPVQGSGMPPHPPPQP